METLNQYIKPDTTVLWKTLVSKDFTQFTIPINYPKYDSEIDWRELYLILEQQEEEKKDKMKQRLKVLRKDYVEDRSRKKATFLHTNQSNLKLNKQTTKVKSSIFKKIRKEMKVQTPIFQK